MGLMGLWELAATASGAYLLGSVPFGLVVSRLFRLGDIRSIGSGNIGATNVLRTGNRLAALLTLVGDAGKGAVAVLLARGIFDDSVADIAALFAMLGHLYPFSIGFRGGKGVATFLGTLLALSAPVGLVACATWLAMALIFRISSLAALVAVATAPVWMAVFDRERSALLVAVMAIFIVWKHRANIARLLASTEPKIGDKG